MSELYSGISEAPWKIAKSPYLVVTLLWKRLKNRALFFWNNVGGKRSTTVGHVVLSTGVKGG